MVEYKAVFEKRVKLINYVLKSLISHMSLTTLVAGCKINILAYLSRSTVLFHSTHRLILTMFVFVLTFHPRIVKDFARVQVLVCRRAFEELPYFRNAGLLHLGGVTGFCVHGWRAPYEFATDHLSLERRKIKLTFVEGTQTVNIDTHHNRTNSNSCRGTSSTFER